MEKKCWIQPIINGIKSIGLNLIKVRIYNNNYNVPKKLHNLYF